MRGQPSNSLDAYRDVGTYASVGSATPHGLIELLLNGALERIAGARGHMQRQEVARKGECIGKAIAIVEGLRMSLDQESGSQLAGSLDDLYEYMGRRLLQASVHNDPRILDEVSGLLHEIKDAWDTIPEPGPAV